jgi:hypothetical protein
MMRGALADDEWHEKIQILYAKHIECILIYHNPAWTALKVKLGPLNDKTENSHLTCGMTT